MRRVANPRQSLATGFTHRRVGNGDSVRVGVLPGVYRPRSDTKILARCLRDGSSQDRHVLDLCTGSGALGVAAALGGARSVTAVDLSRSAVLTARLNARLNDVEMRVLRSDLFDALGDRRFDLIVSNPPYLPSPDAELPRRGVRRAWEAGPDGRALIDRILAEAPRHLLPGGSLLMVHSSVCDTERTVGGLAGRGLKAEVVERHRGPLGPLLAARASELMRLGLLEEGLREEEMVVVRGRLPAAG